MFLPGKMMAICSSWIAFEVGALSILHVMQWSHDGRWLHKIPTTLQTSNNLPGSLSTKHTWKQKQINKLKHRDWIRFCFISIHRSSRINGTENSHLSSLDYYQNYHPYYGQMQSYMSSFPGYNPSVTASVGSNSTGQTGNPTSNGYDRFGAYGYSSNSGSQATGSTGGGGVTAGLVTNSIIFCWIFTIKDWCKKCIFDKHTIKVCVRCSFVGVLGQRHVP